MNPPAQKGPAADPATTTKKGPRVSDLSEAFQSLPPAARVSFVRDNIEHFPADLWIRIQKPKAERLDYAPADIMLRVTSKTEWRRLRSCSKEPFTVAWIERMIDAGDVLYDIGANVGAYSLVAAKKPTGAARVFAFEASLENIAALGHNIVLNDVAADVTPLPIALSNTNGLGTFNLRRLEPGSAKHMLNGESPDGPTLYAQPVITYRLDDLIRLLNLPLPHHIKLDVDGCEMAVLEGAAQTIASPALKTMLVEVSTELSNEVTEFLEVKGLHLCWRARIRSKSGVYRVWYGLFLRTPAGGPIELPTPPAAEVVA